MCLGGGWKEDPKKQKSIVVQSLMKAAAEAAGNLSDVQTTEEYLTLIKKMIQLHDTVVKKVGGLDFAKLTKEPKPKPRPQPKIENEELEVDVEAEDSDDPYDLD